MNMEFKITGVLLESESGKPIPGLPVRAYDKDFLYDDLLGNAVSDQEGRFEINYAGSDFKELFDNRPDIYFKILDTSGKRVIHTTADAVQWNAGKDEYFEIRIPVHKLPATDKLIKQDIRFTDAQGKQRTTFEIGDSLMLQLNGLTPDQSFDIKLYDDQQKNIFNVQIASNRFGVIAPTVLWPDIGIGIPGEGGPYAFETHEEAMKEIGGRSFSLEISEKGKKIGSTVFRMEPAITRTRLYAATASGILQRGLLLGKDELRIQGVNFPAGELIDIYLVKRRNDWTTGKPIVPVQHADGSPVMITIQLEKGQTTFNTVLWKHDALQTGSYDIIARVTAENEYLRREMIFRETDFVSERFLTSLVIRDDIFHYKPVHMGCVMAMRDIAAKMLWGVPEEVQYTNNFPKGTDVWAALDPAGLMPGAIGKKVKMFVVPHKTAAQWTADSSLASVPGTASPEIITSASCVNANATLVWSNPQQAGKYDLVVDFGNNAPDPANFVSDHSFDPPADMIDGYFNVGFYVTDDPSVAGPFPVGQTSYNDPAVTIPAAGVWGPGGVIYGNTPSGTLSLPMAAEVRYPADMNGVNVPVSASKPNYPLVVVMHGMHSTADPSYLGYNYLLDHLASHGFIAVSIDCNAINAIGGMQDTRGHAILEHLSLLQSKNSSPGLFNGKIDMNNIGIMGHSRGGDGVVQAEIYNQGLGLGWHIKAIIPLAPTDFSGTSPAPLNLTTSTLFCIYGSNDGDVWGGSNPATQYTGTGFRFYDRASIEKAMVFIYGATHNRFNTQWGTESKVDASSPKVLSATQHQQLLKGYMTACLQVQLQGRSEQLDYLTGELRIPQVSSVDVHNQYRKSGHLTLDDFESNPSLTQNTLGGTVSFANLDGSPQEDIMGTIDPNSPHQTKGLRLKWNALTGTYQSQIPLSGSQRDVSAFKFLSFRVSQKVGSAANIANQLQDLRVRITTAGGGSSRALRAGYYSSIPYPYKPEYISAYDSSEGPNTKAALKTIRIPLYGWTIKCLNVPIVDLTNVESVTFEFNYKPSGELEIDDVEFTS